MQGLQTCKRCNMNDFFCPSSIIKSDAWEKDARNSCLNKQHCIVGVERLKSFKVIIKPLNLRLWQHHTITTVTKTIPCTRGYLNIHNTVNQWWKYLGKYFTMLKWSRLCCNQWKTQRLHYANAILIFQLRGTGAGSEQTLISFA